MSKYHCTRQLKLQSQMARVVGCLGNDPVGRTKLTPFGALTFLARGLPGASLDNLLVASPNGNFLGYLTDFLKKSWAKSTLLVKIYLKMTFLGLLSKNQ